MMFVFSPFNIYDQRCLLMLATGKAFLKIWNKSSTVEKGWVDDDGRFGSNDDTSHR